MNDRPSRYKLQVRLEIVKEEYTGAVNADGTYDSEDRSGYWSNTQNERLSVAEDLMLGSMDFLGTMKVLGDLHTAMKNIKPK